MFNYSKRVAPSHVLRITMLRPIVAVFHGGALTLDHEYRLRCHAQCWHVLDLNGKQVSVVNDRNPLVEGVDFVIDPTEFPFHSFYTEEFDAVPAEQRTAHVTAALAPMNAAERREALAVLVAHLAPADLRTYLPVFKTYASDVDALYDQTATAR